MGNCPGTRVGSRGQKSAQFRKAPDIFQGAAQNAVNSLLGKTGAAPEIAYGA